MPSLGGATGWLNSEPLGPAELRGHVVLVNFWTRDLQRPRSRMKVGTGDFSYSGAGIKNGIDQEFTVNVRGKVRTSSKIRGTMTYEKTKGNGPACKTTTKFSAKRTRKPHA
jgi:hypothetical protein